MKTAMHLYVICLVLVSFTKGWSSEQQRHTGDVNELFHMVSDLRTQVEELKIVLEKDAEEMVFLKEQIKSSKIENNYLRQRVTLLEYPTQQALSLSNQTRATRAGGGYSATNPTISFFIYLERPIRQPHYDHVIRLDTQVINDGNAYDTFSGYFTCPKPGVYVFGWSIGEVVHGPIYSELEKNAQTVGWAITGDTVYAASSTQTAILRLNAGDKVNIKISSTGNAPTLWEKFSSFSGFLLA